MVNETLQVIGRRMRALRTDKGLSQAALGQMLSVSQDPVALWEKSKSVPPVDIVIMLSRIFEVSCDYLLGVNDY